ncbi:MAG TPA: helix-turn-helix transcriptional regulator [Caulobacteraceae bacterium]|jgi:transcriptional regulator with XRE-family HTH domain
MSRLGELESLVEEGGSFAARVAAVEFVRSVAGLLKNMRERAGFTQRELGRMIGLSQGRISQLESGLMDYAPNLETVALYANACDESVRFEASGEMQEEPALVLSVYDTDPSLVSESGIELVCNVASVRSMMTRQSGITPVRGSENRLRLGPAVSADVMHVLGIK